MVKEGRELLSFSHLQTKKLDQFSLDQLRMQPYLFLALLQQFPTWNYPHLLKNLNIKRYRIQGCIVCLPPLFLSISKPLFLEELPLLYLVQPNIYPLPQATAGAGTAVGEGHRKPGTQVARLVSKAPDFCLGYWQRFALCCLKLLAIRTISSNRATPLPNPPTKRYSVCML